MAIGQHFFGHYYLQVLPPLAALAATQIDRISLAAGAAGRPAVAPPRCGWGSPCSLPRPDLPPYVRLVAQIDRLSDRDDPILVWGVFSEATWASARPMASRFPHTNFVTGVDQGRPTQGALDDLCQDIEARAADADHRHQPGQRPRLGQGADGRRAGHGVACWPSYRRQADVDGIVIYKLVQPDGHLRPRPAASAPPIRGAAG